MVHMAFDWLKQHKIGLAVVLLIVGVVIGFGISVRSNLLSRTDASSGTDVALSAEGDAADLQQAFVKVADVVGPAVVSIFTETTQRVPVRRYYFGPPKGFFDDDFDRFFRNFFGKNLPEREFKRQGMGSGVIIDERGYIITNDHVIAGADNVRVKLSDGRSFNAEVKGSDIRNDIAVIKIDADDLPVARLGDSDSVKTGQWAIAIGNPFGLFVENPKPTVTVGVVSALHRSLPLGSSEGRNYIDLIQTDAAINPGNSGGPLCDLEGNIIGLNVAIVSTTGGYQGIGFAIPVNTVKWALDDLMEGKEVIYGWLGVTVQMLTQEMAEYFNISDGKGVIVIEVIEGSPAYKAGVKTGDIIRTFNGKSIDTLQTLLKYVAETEVNKRSRLGIIRDGRQMTLSVVIGQRPDEQTLRASKSKGVSAPPEAEAAKWRGLTVSDITDEVARRYGIEIQQGVLILDVDVDSPAYEAGLRKGVVIKEIDKRLIRDRRDYDKAVQTARGNTLVRTNKGYVIIKEE